MDPEAILSQPLRVADLAARKHTRFTLAPDAAMRARLAEALGITAVEALSFAGSIAAMGKGDWRLEGRMTARVVQPCVVTLAPVTTAIEVAVERLYLARMPEIEASEVEMPEDVSIEPLGAVIDPGAVLGEELALALPAYPRTEGAEFAASEFAAPGTEPLGDTARRPFAGLAGLLDKAAKKP